MPGAMCGLWGVCGSSNSITSVLSIIEGTGPLSNGEDYKKHMELTSKILSRMSKIGGPRCCKRNAYISIEEGILYANKNYNLDIILNDVKCEFSNKNLQCLKEKCPFLIKE